MRKLIFTCIAATLVGAPMTTIVKAEDTTIIKRDRDGEGDKTVIKKREGGTQSSSGSPYGGEDNHQKRTRLTQRHLISRKNAWAASWLGLNRPLFLNPGHPPPVRGSGPTGEIADVALEANF